MARKNCKNCIWADQCEETEEQPVDLTEDCDDFSSVDDSADREAYYIKTLQERQEDYMEVIKEYR